MDSLYLEKVDHYYDELIPRLVSLLTSNGGPVIAMQIENEYGSYGNDTAYLEYLKDGLIKRGVDVLLFTSDGPTDGMQGEPFQACLPRSILVQEPRRLLPNCGNIGRKNL